MSKHLFGIVATHHGTAANNRGETEGNITTLQKLLWNGEVHTTVSAEAIRFALRMFWQRKFGDAAVNRRWNDAESRHDWADASFSTWADHIDDDVLGFMSAQAGKTEGNEGEGEAAGGKKPKKVRGTCDKRRGRLDVTRAISLTPFAGDITFNAASPGATPSASSTGKDPVPYGTELHATRYQYGFALTPEALGAKARALDVVDGIVHLPEVAGNHGRFLYDFTPDSAIFRWTDDAAPRMLYAFEPAPAGTLDAAALVARVEAGDLVAKELFVGGTVAATGTGKRLAALGAFVVPGVKAAAEELKARMKADLGI